VTGTVAAIASVTTAVAAPIGLAAAVEDEGTDCPVSVPASLPANSRLPDPFRRPDGTRITTKADWRCQRAQTKELAERFVYGDKPARPQTVTGTVSSTNITVNVSNNGRSASFSAGVQLPSGTGPFPAVVVVGGIGADTATIRAAGAAVISYDPLAVGREGTPRTNKQGAFYTIYGNTSTTGLLAAWAWGVSRIIDVIEQSGGTILRANATGVTGLLPVRQGRLRDRRARSAHRTDDADRVGQRGCAHPAGHPGRERGPAVEQRLQRTAVAG
jgi:hypothetical protein